MDPNAFFGGRGVTERAVTTESDPIKVILVDDSVIIRGFYRRMLASEPDIEVVADAGNGEQAVERLRRTPADVMILDVEMPVMDGLAAIPHLLTVQPDLKIIMSSTLTARNAEISVKAMSAGACEYVQKPSAKGEIATEQSFRRDLMEKVRHLGVARRRAAQDADRPIPVPARTTASVSWARSRADEVALRTPGTLRPQVIAIGSSTGGPQALQTVLAALNPRIGLPVVVTQHMPAAFTRILAEHLDRKTAWSCREAADGDALVPGEVLVAPGGFHMLVKVVDGGHVVTMNQDPPENFCRPAVDPMFRSVAGVFGGHVLAIILTGMGTDGTQGAKVIIEKGGTVIAQDEETSVVWGMPGSAAAAGTCSAVLPLPGIAGYVEDFIARAGR